MEDAELIKDKYVSKAFQWIVISTSIVYMPLTAIFLFSYLYSGDQTSISRPIAFIFFGGSPQQRVASIIITWPFPLDNVFIFLIITTLGLLLSLWLIHQALSSFQVDVSRPLTSLTAILKSHQAEKKDDDTSQTVKPSTSRKHLALASSALMLYSVIWLMYFSTALQGLLAAFNTTNDLVLLVVGIGGGLAFSILVGIVGVLVGIGKYLGNVGFILFFVALTIFIALTELVFTGNITYGNLPLSLTAIGILGGGIGFLVGVVLLDRKIMSNLEENRLETE